MWELRKLKKKKKDICNSLSKQIVLEIYLEYYFPV